MTRLPDGTLCGVVSVGVYCLATGGQVTVTQGPIAGFGALVRGTDGALYGTSRNYLTPGSVFRFDPATGDKKHWYKKAAAPLIGEDLAYRKKQMFTVPIGDWFRGESHSWLQSVLEGSEALREWFEPAAVASMLERHRDGSANFTRELRALAALALWDAGR